MVVVYNRLDKPKDRIELLKQGMSELDIGRAYQTLRGYRIVL